MVLEEKIKTTLLELPVDKEGTVIELANGRNFNARMRSIGVNEGSKIIRLSDPFPVKYGPIRIKSDDTTLILGYGEAEKVIVEYKKE